MKIQSLLVFFFIPFFAIAQYGDNIRTARPGQAIGAFTLGKNVFQMQTGFNNTYLRIPGLGISERKVLSQNTVLRLGISEHFELSSVINWSSRRTDINGSQSSIGGISATQFGARYNFTSNDGLLPTLGLQYRAFLKLQSESFRTNDIGSRFILSTGNKITDYLNLTTNWILHFDGFDSNPDFGYVINTSISLSKKWSTFVEVFGSFDPLYFHFDTGIGYLVNKDFQLDISAGYFDVNSASDFFYDFGMSWRFDWRK